MTCKSNNNSYHDGTSAFFDIFFEKDPHLNAVVYQHKSFSPSFWKFLSYGHRAVLPRFKKSKWDCESTKICDATTLFSNKTEVVKWDRKYQDCHWVTRDYKGLPFFQTIRDVISFWFGRFPAGQKATLQKLLWNPLYEALLRAG